VCASVNANERKINKQNENDENEVDEKNAMQSRK
jgi:hypothetical protein